MNTLNNKINNNTKTNQDNIIIKKILENDQEDQTILNQISSLVMNNGVVCTDEEDCDVFDETDMNKESKY